MDEELGGRNKIFSSWQEHRNSKLLRRIVIMSLIYTKCSSDISVPFLAYLSLKCDILALDQTFISLFIAIIYLCICIGYLESSRMYINLFFPEFLPVLNKDFDICFVPSSEYPFTVIITTSSKGIGQRERKKPRLVTDGRELVWFGIFIYNVIEGKYVNSISLSDPFSSSAGRKYGKWDLVNF